MFLRDCWVSWGSEVTKDKINKYILKRVKCYSDCEKCGMLLVIRQMKAGRESWIYEYISYLWAKDRF